MTCEEQLKQTEEINNRLGQTVIRIMVHCAKMNDRIEVLEKEGKDVSLVRELIADVMREIGT